MNMEFDDIVTDPNEDGGGKWTQLCEEHKAQAEDAGLGTSSDNPGEAICGCKECQEQGIYYFDFFEPKKITT